MAMFIDYGDVVVQGSGARMTVLVNGTVEEREVRFHRHHNGYPDLAFPVMEANEQCLWLAGSRVPEIIKV